MMGSVYEMWSQTCLDKNSGSTTNQIWDLGKVTQPFRALVPSLVGWR